MSDRSKPRTDIVSLTQTEIMLVLAVVILLLLLLKEADLAVANEDLATSRRHVALLEKDTTKSAEEVASTQSQVDFASEVKRMLVRNGATPQDGTGPARLQERDVERLRHIFTEKAAHDEEAAMIDRALARSAPNTLGQDLRERKIQRLVEDAQVGQATRKHLNAQGGRALEEALADAARGDLAPLDDLASEWMAHSRPQGAEAGGLGNRVGFDPCWRRPGAKNERRYYYAYDVTFAEGKYMLAAHSDWGRGIATIDEALAGRLAVLRRYPQSSMTPEALREFGERVEEALAQMRSPSPDAPYPRGCLLAVTLNEEAPGSIANFVRHAVGFYPITRSGG